MGLPGYPSLMRYLHTMIRVRDLDSALRFFCEGLGLVEISSEGIVPPTRRIGKLHGRIQYHAHRFAVERHARTPAGYRAP